MKDLDSASKFTEGPSRDAMLGAGMRGKKSMKAISLKTPPEIWGELLDFSRP